MKDNVNKTQLSPDKTFTRGIFHRDQFAHYLRWSFILRQCNIGERILDIGCGSANLAEVLYRNRFKPDYYFGIDVRKQILKKNKEKKFNFKTIFEYCDIRETKIALNNYTKICCFEVIEHFEKHHIDGALLNIKNAMDNDTLLYLSTPNYNGSKASNHVYEYEFLELKLILEKYFKIQAIYGTFASKRDLQKVMSPEDLMLYAKLEKYYDSNIMSVIFAPLYVEASRNCMWVLKK